MVQRRNQFLIFKGKHLIKFRRLVLQGKSSEVMERVKTWVTDNLDKFINPTGTDDRKDYYEKVKVQEQLMDKAEAILMRRRIK